ncbi:hypothetical protein HOS18_gp38 [Aeromonas phage CF7]|uniref:Uncharacterized protein n=3 Tax=Viruses TaxID=10239 RepID=A0A249XLB5_9CAUD|nr:hypothetical protein HOS18_gp38 [Aeromonas phage CF7]ASZ71984.1 hypothetical protein CF7_38 [Aeromonas phage CF7]UZV40978.1 hypothetical protein P2_0022 [Aeromonas phage P2]
MRKVCTEIKLPLLYADGSEDRHVFNLGLGPCGKVVKSLSYRIKGATVTVKQHTECGEVKLFVYPLASINGRITITK